MTKKGILGIVFSSVTIVLATGAMLWFEGTHSQMKGMLPGYREFSEAGFAWGNVSWAPVAITFVVMVALAFPWWAFSFADEETNEPSRKFSLFPFMQMRSLDRLITMFNVFSVLGVTFSLLLLAQMGLKQFDPLQANRIMLYLNSLLIFWGLVYFLVAFLMWRRRKNEEKDRELAVTDQTKK